MVELTDEERRVYVTKYKHNTVRLREQYEEYLRHKDRTLYDCYENCSEAKREAYRECKTMCAKFQGQHLTVVCYNSFQFTAGFEFSLDDKLYYMHISAYSYNVLEVVKE